MAWLRIPIFCFTTPRSMPSYRLGAQPELAKLVRQSQAKTVKVGCLQELSHNDEPKPKLKPLSFETFSAIPSAPPPLTLLGSRPMSLPSPKACTKNAPSTGSPSLPTHFKTPVATPTTFWITFAVTGRTFGAAGHWIWYWASRSESVTQRAAYSQTPGRSERLRRSTSTGLATFADRSGPDVEPALTGLDVHGIPHGPELNL